MRKATVIPLLGALVVSAFFLIKADPSITRGVHFTRNGKAHWYSATNGGFEQYTNIPMTQLACAGCHAATLADGTPVDPATYQPSCDDCHIEIGDRPANSVCLGCHSRQNTEISLSKNANPVIADRFTDVHRDEYGMGCVDCHTEDELHGDGVRYNSMFEASHLNTTCDDCHGGVGQSTVVEHQVHASNLECSSCHAKTVVACYNCHFETEVEADRKRFYGPPPLNDFVLLVNNSASGKIGPASFQSLTYGDVSFYGMGPFGPHTITRDGRTCSDCHDNANVRAYAQSGSIPFVTWDAAAGILSNATGVIPVPPDYRTALAMDFVRFKGNPSDPVANPRDPTQWEFLKSGATDAHMLFAEPLSADQIARMSVAIVDVETSDDVPEGFELRQNYPNPFNPSTTIPFELPRPMRISLTVLDMAGRVVARPLAGVPYPAGRYLVPFDASGLPSGVYVYRVEADRFALARTMTLVR